MELAQELDLWPDSRVRGLTEREDLTPLRLFATDGSYKAEPTGAADVITPESMIRDNGKEAGGMP
jgi:hypothetical protein